MADNLKILVVDDEPIVIRSCEAVLKSEGYNVSGLLSAEEAILRMEQQSFDLVFTDLKMPEVDGITLIRWIKKTKPETGIVIITGYPSQETMKEAIELGIILCPQAVYTVRSCLMSRNRPLPGRKEESLSVKKERKNFHLPWLPNSTG